MPGNPDISEYSSGTVAPLDWTITAAEAVRRWPDTLPLICLSVPPRTPTSHGPADASGWTIFTTPAACATGGLGLLAGASIEADRSSNPLPFLGGWVGLLDYEAGFEAEPSAAPVHFGGQPEAVSWLDCPGALLHDASSNQWYRVGHGDHLPNLAARRAPSRSEFSWHAGPLHSIQGRDAYVDAVARAVEYTRSGDIFQANIAHQLAAEFEGAPDSPRAARGLFARLLESARPRHGAFLELENRTVVSMSPELFIEADFATGAVRTRPIKGTRPAALADELRASEKDAAELVMIVDLMRNDLGRVCRYQSIRVDAPSILERHGPIVHTVATVSGRLREGVGLQELMRAAFPAGSITGAPKVRAMQVINELERFRRAAYCGSIGFISRCGQSVWNVAIRTATIENGQLIYPVGAGIVEGSDPALEWQETLHKAEGFARVMREGQRERDATPITL